MAIFLVLLRVRKRLLAFAGIASPRLPALPEKQPHCSQAPETIGVLLIHGMGDHRRGDTLRTLGESLYRWIEGWLPPGDATMPPPVALDDTSLRLPDRSDLLAPPHTRMEIQLPDDGEPTGPSSVTYIFAESWWADEFYPPPFTAVATWALGVSPRLIVRYIETSGFQGSRRLLPLQFLLALIFIVLFQFVLLMLVIVGTVPKVGKLVQPLVLKLTGSFGDPYVMLTQGVTAAAIRTRVEQDLYWLRDKKKCTKIAIIAHSQGTAIAYDVLQSQPSDIRLFITFGAVLKKLQLAKDMQANTGRLSLGAVLASIGTGFLIAAAVLVECFGMRNGSTVPRARFDWLGGRISTFSLACSWCWVLCSSALG